MYCSTMWKYFCSVWCKTLTLSGSSLLMLRTVLEITWRTCSTMSLGGGGERDFVVPWVATPGPAAGWVDVDSAAEDSAGNKWSPWAGAGVGSSAGAGAGC